MFSHVERPHAAMVMRDPLDLMIKGVRYQINSAEHSQVELRTHYFSFESWKYKARGPIEHRNFLSFRLKDRSIYDTNVMKYVSDLSVFNRHLELNEQRVYAALKFAAHVIEHINHNKKIDIEYDMKLFGLLDEVLQPAKRGVRGNLQNAGDLVA